MPVDYLQKILTAKVYDVAIDHASLVTTYRDSFGAEIREHGIDGLLQTLAEMPKQVFSREMLLEKVWGYQYKADTRLVNVHVQRLRSKIEDDPEDPKIVVTERGVGYKAGSTS